MTIKREALLGAAILALTAGTPVLAQEAEVPATGAATPPTAGLGDIVVTAQRRRERLQDTPAAITALDSRTLQQFDIQNSRDMIGVVPNLYQGRVSTAPSTQTYGMRGLGQTDTLGDPTVGIYMDDIYLPRALGILFDVPGLERIEALRGPQGTLYGRNATAGAIRYITQAPDETSHFSGSLGAGNHDQLEISALASGAVANDVYVSAAAIHRQRDGYTYDETTHRWLNNLNSTAGRLTVRATPGSRLDLRLTLDGVYDNSDTTVYVPNTPPAGQVHDPYVSYEGPAFRYHAGGRPQSRLTELGASFTAKYDLTDAMALKFISAYRGFGGPYDNENDGLPALSATYIKYHEREHTDELQFTGSADRLKWTSGFFYFYEDYQLNPIINTGTRTLAYPDLTTNSYAGYAQFDYELLKGLTLTAGGRYSRETRKFANTSYATDTAFDPIRLIYSSEGKKTYSSFDPKVGLQYKWTPNLMTYASYAKGFQAGGFSIRAASALTAQVAYDPERVKSLEAGLKADWLDHQLRTNIAVFHNKITGFQATAYVPSINTSTVINAGAAITKGVELEVAATPVDGLQLSGSMGHTASHYTRFDNPFGPGTTGVGKHLVFAPRWVASGSVAYTLPVDLPGKVTLGGQVQYTSRTYVDVVNTPNADAPPQTFVNANIGYALPGGHWKLKLSVENLFDVAYRQFTFSLPGVSGSSYNPPRMVMGQVSFNY